MSDSYWAQLGRVSRQGLVAVGSPGIQHPLEHCHILTHSWNTASTLTLTRTNALLEYSIYSNIATC